MDPSEMMETEWLAEGRTRSLLGNGQIGAMLPQEQYESVIQEISVPPTPRQGSKVSVGEDGSKQGKSKTTGQFAAGSFRSGSIGSMSGVGSKFGTSRNPSKQFAEPFQLSQEKETKHWKVALLGALEPPVLPTAALQRATAAELSEFAMSQVNQMYAHMERTMARERARHACDMGRVMRKVDNDLKGTFNAVRETFVSLTSRVNELMQEVEDGKGLIASIQEKFDFAKNSAMISVQYVEELESVLDGQVPNISQAMRKLSEELTVARNSLNELTREKVENEEESSAEIERLRVMVKELYDKLNEKEQAGLPGCMELPLLPEMSSTWTRRASSRTPSHASTAQVSSSASEQPVEGSLESPSPSSPPAGRDVVGVMIARSDATRAVSRSKNVRLPGRLSEPSQTSRTLSRNHPLRKRAEMESVIANLKERLHASEQRVARQHRLVFDLSPSMQVLREIFGDLRQNWRLKLPEIPDKNRNRTSEEIKADRKMAAEAPDLLDRIVNYFVTAFPKIGNFSELLEALREEAEKPAPSLDGLVDKFHPAGSGSADETTDKDDGEENESPGGRQGSHNVAFASPINSFKEPMEGESDTFQPTPLFSAGLGSGLGSFKPTSLIPLAGQRRNAMAAGGLPLLSETAMNLSAR